MMDHFKQETDRERDKLREAGVEFIELVPEDSQRFQDLWINVYWETWRTSCRNRSTG